MLRIHAGENDVLDLAAAHHAEAQRLRVMGAGAVYVVDGMRESYTNLSEDQTGD